MRRSVLLAAVALVAFGSAASLSCKGSTPPETKAAPDVPDAPDTSGFTLSSPAFGAGAAIPSKYTCDGPDVSPPLEWNGAPATTRSFALIVDDPDAPGGTWTHWVLFDVPAGTTKLAEGSRGVGIEAKTSWDKVGWGGPCPPSGTHHYYFRLLALDVPSLGTAAGASRADVEAAARGHVIGRASWMGTYAKQSK
jgi:hypothetical protein